MDPRPVLMKILQALPETKVVQQKSQISLRCGGHPYAALYPVSSKKLGLAIFLNERIDSTRLYAVSEPYPGRFTHHLRLESPEQADEELLGWLRRAAQWKRGR